MGRHSAPDDDDEAGVPVAVAAPPAPAPRPRPGRHSHPDDAPASDVSTDTIERIADPVLDEPLPVAETTVIETVPARDGLFADLLDTSAAEPVASPAPPPEPAASPKPSKPPKPAKPKRPEPHLSDRALLRSNSAARARVIAAVVVPFVLYVIVLFALDALDVRTLLIWIWVPLITAGVVAGLILDLAHRAAAQKAP